MAIFKLEQIERSSGYRLRLRYADGVEGEVDLSDLVGRGVFKRLADPHEFDAAYIAESGDLAWSEDLELCADALYMKLTARTPEEVFPGLGETASHA
jgi:hypothetical protein